MKSQDVKKYHQSTIKEIYQKIQQLKTELFNAKQQLKINKLKNTRQTKAIRYQIVALKTIARHKELEATSQEQK